MSFSCTTDAWPTESPAVCFGDLQVAGRQMHAWVAFADSPKVLALNLLRDLPLDASDPPSAPPWVVTTFAFAVPPAGFVMP